MSKVINPKTGLNYFYSISPYTIFNLESKPKQKHMLFVSIPMGVYTYQAADWSVDVRHSTMFGYVTKNKHNSAYPRELIDLSRLMYHRSQIYQSLNKK